MRHSKKAKYYAENRQKPQNKSSDPKKESDERRGIKRIGFKVPITFANELAKKTGKTKNVIIMESVKLWAKQA